jgi:hypothetical protein
MHTKLTISLVAALVLGTMACGAAVAQGYEGVTWSIGETTVTENTTVTSKSVGAMKFEDTKEGAVECKLTDEGKVGPEGKDETTALSTSECKTVSACEEGTISVKAVHLPWKTHLEEVEGGVRDKISNSGAGTPGWVVECHVFGILITDECTGETSTDIEDVSSGVDGVFESKSAHLNCSLGGTGTGVGTGTDLSEGTSGKTLTVDGDGEEDCGIVTCSLNDISVNFTKIEMFHVTMGKTTRIFTNHNLFRSWRPKDHNVKQISNSSFVWGITDGCSGHSIAPRGGTCEVEIEFTPNSEPGTFISELEMEGAPASANVRMEGSR